LRLKDFSRMVNGTVFGDPEIELTGVSGIQDAGDGDITFISSPGFRKYLEKCRASCVIVKEVLGEIDIAQVQVSNPQYAFAKAIEFFYPRPVFAPGISPKAVVSDKASIGEKATIFPFAYISDGASVGDETVIFPGVYIGEGSSIGRRCVVHPNAVIHGNVKIGDGVIIHPGAVIGSDGFGFVFEAGEHYKIPQVGRVIVHDNVEIGANACVDRATLGETRIGKGTKIDNLVQIAHNVRIGEKSIIVSQVGIAGSCEIGDFVTLAGQAGLADHATIDSGTVVAAQAGVAGHLSRGVYSGAPAIPHKNWLRSQALFARLPELQKRIHDLEEKLKILEKERADAEHK